MVFFVGIGDSPVTPGRQRVSKKAKNKVSDFYVIAITKTRRNHELTLAVQKHDQALVSSLMRTYCILPFSLSVIFCKV